MVTPELQDRAQALVRAHNGFSPRVTLWRDEVKVDTLAARGEQRTRLEHYIHVNGVACADVDAAINASLQPGDTRPQYECPPTRFLSLSRPMMLGIGVAGLLFGLWLMRRTGPSSEGPSSWQITLG